VLPLTPIAPTTFPAKSIGIPPCSGLRRKLHIDGLNRHARKQRCVVNQHVDLSELRGLPDRRIRFSFASDIGPNRNTVATLLGQFGNYRFGGPRDCAYN